jgi:hypothetical protein
MSAFHSHCECVGNTFMALVEDLTPGTSLPKNSLGSCSPPPACHNITISPATKLSLESSPCHYGIHSVETATGCRCAIAAALCLQKRQPSQDRIASLAAKSSRPREAPLRSAVYTNLVAQRPRPAAVAVRQSPYQQSDCVKTTTSLATATNTVAVPGKQPQDMLPSCFQRTRKIRGTQGT